MDNLTPLPGYKTRSHFHPLYINGNLLYASRGYDLFVSNDYGDSFERAAACSASMIRYILARMRMPARVLREGFHAVQPLPDGSLIGLVRGAVVYMGGGENVFSTVHTISRGSRPLNLCLSPSDRLYFGEYFGNLSREEVHIYGSEDGEHWDVTYTFPSGTIRHVHGIIADHFRQGLWVLTGDEGREAGLWFTADDFTTLEAVARGTQKARAVSVIPVKDGLIVPTDTPHEQNYIQHLDIPTGRFENLVRLPSSAFDAVNSGGLYLVSTVVEPSSVNRSRCATVYASLDGRGWHCIGRFGGKFLSIHGMGRFLQYPRIILALGDSTVPYVFAFGVTVRDIDGHLVRWSVEDIKGFIGKRPQA